MEERKKIDRRVVKVIEKRDTSYKERSSYTSFEVVCYSNRFVRFEKKAYFIARETGEFITGSNKGLSADDVKLLVNKHMEIIASIENEEDRLNQKRM